jgi:hypothetical protein
LALYRAFSERFSQTHMGVSFAAIPVRTAFSRETRNPVRILGAERVKLAYKRQAERIFAFGEYLGDTSSVLLRKPPSPAGEGFRGFGFFYAPLCATAQFSLRTDTAT